MSFLPEESTIEVPINSQYALNYMTPSTKHHRCQAISHIGILILPARMFRFPKELDHAEMVALVTDGRILKVDTDILVSGPPSPGRNLGTAPMPTIDSIVWNVEMVSDAISGVLDTTSRPAVAGRLVPSPWFRQSYFAPTRRIKKFPAPVPGELGTIQSPQSTLVVIVLAGDLAIWALTQLLEMNIE